MLRGTVQRRAGMSASGAVVAVHGGPGVDGAGLRHVLAPLADDAELVVPDQRGHGRSDLATAASWRLDDWADDLAGVIGALQLHRPVVVGVSFGGWVALRYAARHPGQLGGLVIAASTARLLSVEEGAERMGSLGGPASAAAWRAAYADPALEASPAFERHVLSLMAVREPSPALRAVRAAQVRRHRSTPTSPPNSAGSTSPTTRGKSAAPRPSSSASSTRSPRRNWQPRPPMPAPAAPGSG